MKKKLKIGVLVGGPSAERAVSLVTGQAIYQNLDRKKYQVKLIELSTKCQFTYLPDKGTKKILDLVNRDRHFVDLMFIALHGKPGEDGTVQGMLELLGIPYTGSDVAGSALAINKEIAAKLYQSHGLPTPEFIPFTKADWKRDGSNLIKRISGEINFPCVIKPIDQGSAVGVFIPKDQKQLEEMIPKALKLFPWLMAQKFIKGQEATCGVLEKRGVPCALPPTHILPNLNEFYDYKSKYKAGGSTHVCPADFSEEVNKKIQELAVSAHLALGCRGMSRTDIFVADDGRLWVIETNTIPGMTPTSLLPEAAGKSGIGFGEMLDLIIASSSS